VSSPTALPFASRRLLVCVGPGGVGKTTLAAAIGLREARAGRKVLVCTIDPARRLANSLGLKQLDNREARVELAGAANGQLFAMMLDLRRSWDDLIQRTAKTTEQRDRIYQNRFYQQLSTTLAGSQEYAAVAKLAELAQERDYELIVLDTPPTLQALDFLDAPTRILDFLDNPAARLLLGPALAAGKMGLSVLNRGSAFIVNGLSRFTGIELLRQLADFMLQISGMYDTFKERALEVRRLLQSESTGFILVASPNPGTIDEALDFRKLLDKGQLPLRAVIANRVNALPDPAARDLGPFGETPLGKKLSATIADASAVATRDAEQLTRLSALGLPILALPRLSRAVFDLEALDLVGDLLASAAVSGRLSAA
jgi:anion-transporting  ArsA/GET3 family ATPase